MYPEEGKTKNLTQEKRKNFHHCFKIPHAYQMIKFFCIDPDYKTSNRRFLDILSKLKRLNLETKATTSLWCRYLRSFFKFWLKPIIFFSRSYHKKWHRLFCVKRVVLSNISYAFLSLRLEFKADINKNPLIYF